MRKFSILLSTIVVLALLLTACGGKQTSTSIPSTNVPPVTVSVTETMSATEAPTEVATEAPTAGVPVTGENNPSRLSNMMNMPLFNQNNEQVGQVQDAVLDLDNSRVAYLVVSTSGTAGNKTVLVPWDSLQLQTSASTSATGQGNALVLSADPNFLNNATDVDVTTLLPGMCQPAGTWDVDIRNFWESGAMPGTTQSANTPSAGNGTTTSATATSSTGTGGTGATATATSASGGTGAVNTTATPSSSTSNNQGQGQGVGQAQKVQGVILASQVIGTTIGFNGQGQGQGTGQTQATAMPETTATATTSGTGGTVATATSSTGGTGGTVATATSGATTGGTGTGNSSVGATQGTVQDVIVDTTTGNLQYLVITTADDNTHWIPIPVGFLRCDPATNGFLLMISPNALQNAPAFAEDQFPDTTTTGWDSEFSTFWQNNGGTSGTGPGGVTASTATSTP